jgi:O-antigen/teichoic acid export membrane protein
VILARHFGAFDYGLLAILQAIVLTTRGFVSAQPWQALVRFGTDFLVKGARSRFSQVARATFFVSIGSAVLSTASTIALVITIGHILGIPREYEGLALLYAATSICNFSDYFTGVFRLFNRYGTIAAYSTGCSGMRFVLAAVIALNNLPFADAMLLIIAFEFCEQIGLIIIGVYIFDKYAPQPILHLIRHPSPGILNMSSIYRFLKSIWTWSTLRMLPRELDILVVSFLLGTAATGIYKVAKQLASITAKIYTPFYEATAPNINYLHSKGDYARLHRLIKSINRLTLASTAATVAIIALVGEPILQYILGAEFMPAYWPAIYYSIALLVFSGSLSFTLFLFAIDRQTFVTQAHLVATVGYFLLLPILVLKYEIIGASLAYLVLHIILTALIARDASHSLLRLRSEA